jgi:hypothetical protein
MDPATIVYCRLSARLGIFLPRVPLSVIVLQEAEGEEGGEGAGGERQGL